MSKMIVIAALAVAMSVAGLSTVSAQNPGGPGNRMGMMGGGCPTMGMMGSGAMMGSGMMGQRGWSEGMGRMMRQPRMDAMVEGRLAYLKSELGITDEQTSAWDAYAATVGERVELMRGMHDKIAEAMAQGTAAERMDARIVAMEAMLESLKAVKPATDALYEEFSDEQRKIADDLIGADCGAM